MIYLVTGLPGHGKSLYAITMLQKFLKEGRPVYANIDGLQMQDVLPTPENWTDTPNGSVVCYDECQSRFPADGGKGRSEDPTIQAMEVHRHSEHDLILITQNAKLLHPHVRRLVGRHHHVERQMGMQYSRLYSADRNFDSDSRSALKQVDSEVWTFPKECYSLYKSASGHNVKVRVDSKLKWAAASMLALVLISCVLVYKARHFWNGDIYAKANEKVTATHNHPVGSTGFITDAVADTVPRLTPVSGCIHTEKRCVCYDSKGTGLDLALDACLKIAETGFPTTLQTSRGPYSSGDR